MDEVALHSITLMYYTGYYKENVIRAGEPTWIFCIGVRLIKLKQQEAMLAASLPVYQ